MARGNYARETSKLAQLDKNVFEAGWIRGCYQLIGPELPAQEFQTQHDQYHMELHTHGCVACNCNLPDHLWCGRDTVRL